MLLFSGQFMVKMEGSCCYCSEQSYWKNIQKWALSIITNNKFFESTAIRFGMLATSQNRLWVTVWRLIKNDSYNKMLTKWTMDEFLQFSLENWWIKTFSRSINWKNGKKLTKNIYNLTSKIETLDFIFGKSMRIADNK